VCHSSSFGMSLKQQPVIVEPNSVLADTSTLKDTAALQDVPRLHGELKNA